MMHRTVRRGFAWLTLAALALLQAALAGGPGTSGGGLGG